MQRSVSPSFFAVMGVPMLAGRSLEPADRRGAPGVAVVNETLVRRYLPGQDPLGKKLVLLENIWQAGDIGFQYGERVVDEVEIVGVVADLRYTGVGDPAEASIYLSNDQYTTRRHNVIVRAALSEPASLAGAIREEINAIARMPVEFELYSQVFRHALARDRFGMSLLATFGVIALVLAAIGVYGLMSYSITQRTGEIAVRAALGASARDVVALVMRRGAWLALTGIAVGLAAAVLVHAVLGSRLYELTTVDWRVFVAAPVMLFAVALLAAYVPARRAARIDPAVMLRTQ
jgi:putative ABC transport system permease protein